MNEVLFYLSYHPCVHDFNFSGNWFSFFFKYFNLILLILSSKVFSDSVVTHF